ncbi:MAG: MiaB/RimO family radical SAM methylthiotransferase, partial [Candidatus Glassbacteria bacterium]|nr:MiaB/RimO family radical SAM methylthiotransferase [Candidatus Glassbacteria bacterium]
DNRDGILTAAGGVATRTEYPDLPVLEAHRGRARGYVKVQDGCDNRCTYCIVPLVRGPSRSRAIEKVVEEAAGLERSGHAEAVLTGIHIGKYGRDLAEDLSLSSLVAAVLDATKKIRLRLSSVEVGELDGALVDHVAGNPRVCRHLHIPLQHGSDPVLRRMDRGYSSAEFSESVESASGRVPGLGLGTDVIAGFPGESEQDFRATYDLLDALPFSYLHVFPYSPRPGTPAAEMQGRPPKAEVTRRVRELRALSARKNLAFRENLAGQRLEVIREVTDSSGTHQCRSDNYVLLSFRGECPPGRFELLATEVDEDGLRAVLPGD